MGNQELMNQLQGKGFETWEHTDNFVCFKFTVPHGKFRGQEIKIALQAPQFPLVPPSGPYISPHLLPMTGGSGTHPYGGIHRRNKPTAEYQYWSRPFKGWVSGMSIEDYLGFLRTLFDFQ
ncbi:hypothetical protein [Ulvibacterium marinum]|uniref:hypothetical protein n=1 Tax=Ulvibacterium marinum TaxID=2419782 RepID=UPI002493DB72|nr:hypothetical protein [Ulvibacterium marinum]